jgi:hypothetical protein
MSARGARYIAKQKGEKQYMSEKPCKRGHIDWRITATGTCIGCRKIQNMAKYYADPVKTKIKTKITYQANAEKIRARRKEWYYSNLEVARTDAKARSAEWRKLNPNHAGTKIAKQKWKETNIGKVRADTVKRRLSKMQRTPKWLTAIDLWMIEETYELAALRTKITGFSWHVDHKIPLQGKLVSGLHTPYNLQVIPGKDNIAKANKYVLT